MFSDMDTQKMKVKNLSSSEREQWYSFMYKGEKHLMIVSMTDKPFRGVSDIKAVYKDEYQNTQADVDPTYLAHVYAEVLKQSVLLNG